MCGIVGISHFARSSDRITPGLLGRMRDAMEHRGPDGAGLWIDPNGSAGLAHRRLSIIDLSPDGSQPMTNEDQTLHITFNGEIYNYRDLRPDLVRKGHQFRSNSDTEVILHLYEEHGPGCVEFLDGMFAFGLWDSRKGEWLLARDRLGVKPLYYTVQNSMLIFASEIKALLAHPSVSRELDTEAMLHYLTFKTTPAPMTMFRGIQKLPAGCTLACDRHGDIRVRSYWDAVTAANPPLSHCDEEEAARAVGDLLTNAVRKRMVADVPVGAFLSGGLDSSAVVALMAEHGAAPLHTFSVGIKDLEGYNEFEHARHVADRFGARHHEIMIGRQDVEDYLPKLVYHQDEPLSDPVCVPLYYVSRLAVEAGIKVVQVGEGSDEQFLGYESRVHSLRRYLRTWQPLLSLPAPALRGLHGVAALASRTTNRAGRFERILAKAARGEEPFLGSIAFGDQAKEHILTEKAVGDGLTQAKVDEIVGSLRASWPQSDISHRMMYLDLKLRLAELLLMRVDKVTMSTGLEAREPFMDYRLVEYTMRLPRTVKLKGWDPKHVLKRSMEGRVPESILRRRKQAFAAPVGEWLRHGLGGYARQVILQSSLREQKLFRYDAIGRMLEDHEQRRGDYGVRIWNLMNLSAWHDQWICRRDGGA